MGIQAETGRRWKFPKIKSQDRGEGVPIEEGRGLRRDICPVVKMTSIRTVLSVVANMNLEVEQLDVNTAFLHGDLEEEIYMHQTEGFVEKGKEHLVCQLKKSLYGLKQAPQQWYRNFDSFKNDQGYHKTQSDHCVFVKKFEGGDFLILLLYVDDMLIVRRDQAKIRMMKKALNRTFVMKDRILDTQSEW